jgi:general secretion pathway protein D
VGVVLTVQPRITLDRQRVFLTIKPEVTEFDGFINYGSQIRAGGGDIRPSVTAGTLISNNIINQPVFSVRTVENAQLDIQDGYTMVLGGLIREDISTVEDKVPVLGDIPLVGRLFRSKGEQAVKKNLLMFVTVRILRPDGEPFNVDAGAPVATQAVAR